jgi:nucleoside-diphosphate-sugar epimerase
MGAVPKAVGEAINLASEKETRVIDLANWINELTKNNAGIVFQPKRDWDKVVKRRASIAKATKILGYQPKTEIRQGLKKTLNWILENKEKIEASVPF